MAVLAFSSQVVAGHVGNSTAQVILNMLGHEVWAVPTVLLAHHPGHGAPVGRSTSAQDITALTDSLWQRGWMPRVSAVMTGYFTGTDQIDAAADTIARLKEVSPDLPVLVDPIMGDDGTLYIPEETATALAEKLVPLATITTPNLFELSRLGHQPWPLTQTTDIDAAARSLAVPEVLVTSAPGSSAHHLATRLYAEDVCTVMESDRIRDVPNGTGDVVAATYLAKRLHGKPAATAAKAAVALVEKLIGIAHAEDVVDIPLAAARTLIMQA